MALTKKDLGQIKGVVVEVVEQLVFPKFDELEEKIEKVREDVSTLQSDVARLEKKTDKIAEVLTDTRTNHERRIRRLEKEAGIESPTLAL